MYFWTSSVIRSSRSRVHVTPTRAVSKSFNAESIHLRPSWYSRETTNCCENPETKKECNSGKSEYKLFQANVLFLYHSPPSKNVNKNSGFLTFSGDKELQHYLSELNRLVFLFTFIIQNCNNYSPIYNMITVCSTIINVYNNCKSGDRDAPINILTHSDYLINTSDVKCNVSPVQNY